MSGSGDTGGSSRGPTPAQWGIVALLVATGLVALVGVADLAWGFVFGPPLRYTDAEFARAFAGLRTAGGVTFFRAYTHLGDTVVASVVTLVAAGALWVTRRRDAAVYILGATVSAALFNTLLKEIVLRTRPPAMLAAVQLPRSPSFPSGHAVVGVVLFGTLAVVALRELGLGWKGAGLGVVLASAGVLIGYSRLYLGVHWVTDVLGGWLLGTAWVALWTAGLIVWDARGPSERSGGPGGG